MRRAALGAVCAATLAGGAAAAVIASSGQANAGSLAVRTVGATSPRERISFTLLLRLRARAGVQAPSKAAHFMTARSFGSRFGVSGRRLRALEHAIRTSGLRITAAFPQRTEIEVSGTVATAERLLDVPIVTYRDAAGHRFQAPVGRPVIPAAFVPAVDGIAGLDTRARWYAHDVPLGGLTPALAASAYDVAPLHDAGILGQGQTIAVISFSAFDPGDPAAFASRYGISGPPPEVIPVDGGTTDTSGQAEANLDIDVIRSIAPQAQVLVYEAPGQGSPAHPDPYADVISRIVADGRTKIISSSWGTCELEVSRDELTADGGAMTPFARLGISMFVAAGDSGAYDCQRGDNSDHTLSVDWPSSSVDTIAVGGTRLYLAPDGSYQRETAWDDELSDAGGGGGFSTVDHRPSWQAGPGVLTSASTGGREVPDVSADADPSTGWPLIVGGQMGESGGTSAATPFWAASMALIEQYAAAQGFRGRVGFVAPTLYSLASSTEPFPPFHDVTVGGNRHWQATPGWDPATGLGSPDVYNLARDIVAKLGGR